MLMFLCIAGASAGDVNDTTLKTSTDTIEPTNLNGAATDNSKTINADNETIGVSSENNTKDNEIVNDVLMDSNSNNMDLMNDDNLLYHTPTIFKYSSFLIVISHFSQKSIAGSFEVLGNDPFTSYGIYGIGGKESSKYIAFISTKGQGSVIGTPSLKKGQKQDFNITFSISPNNKIKTYTDPLYLILYGTSGDSEYLNGYELRQYIENKNPWTNIDNPKINIDSVNIGFGQQYYNISGKIEVESETSGYGALLNLATDDGVFLGSTMVNDDGTWTVSGIDSTLLTPGTYSLHADYAGNDNVGNVSNTTGVLTVNIGDFVPTISVGDINWCDDKILTVTIKNGAGTAIKDLNVYFTGTGVSGTLSAMTNKVLYLL